jgi:cation transporter-like permease
MSLVPNEQAKLTASYLNAAAASFFAAGVVAPLAAAVFGLTGTASSISALTLAGGVLIFFVVSVALHIAARHILRGLKP